MCQVEAEKLKVLEGEVDRLHKDNSELIKQLKALPKYIDEYDSQPSGTTLNVPPKTRNIERITSIFAYAATGPVTLTLGDRTIPLSVGLTEIDNKSFLLKYTDKRTLTTGGAAGLLFLELMGEAMGDQLNLG